MLSVCEGDVVKSNVVSEMDGLGPFYMTKTDEGTVNLKSKDAPAVEQNFLYNQQDRHVFGKE